MSLLPSRPDAEPAEDAGPRVIGVDDEAADDVLAALSSGTARSVLSALHDDPAPPSELADRCDTSLQNVQYHLGKLEGAGAVEVVDTAYSAKGREMDVYAPADQPLVVFAGAQEDGSTLRTALKRLLGAVGVLALGSLLIQSLYGDLPVGAPMGSGPDGGAGGGGGDGFGDGASGDADRAPPDGGEDAGNVTFQGETTTPTETAPDTPAETPADTPMATDGGATTTPNGEAEATEEATRTALEETPAQTPVDTPADAARDTTTELATTVADGAQPAAEAATGGLPPGLLFFAGGLFVLGLIGVAWYVSRRWQ